MRMFEAILNFFKSFFGRFKKKELENQNQAELPICDMEDFEEQMHIRQERKIKRSLKERLYVLRQEIVLFETTFPDDYTAFLNRIETLEKQYEESLEEMNKILTFSIDPDMDWGKIGEVVQLEKDVKRFIETQVRFVYLSNKLQRLIVKLNILYNVSIFHSRTSEKEKVISQLEHAQKSEDKLREEFLQSSGMLEEKKLSERMVNLLTYANYIILKLSVRTCSTLPDSLISKQILNLQIEEVHYMEQIKNFIKDEVYDLAEMLHFIQDEECRRILKEKAGKIIVELTHSEDLSKQFSSLNFWNNFLEFENSMLEMLKANGVQKDEAKVKLIARMDIRVEDDDVVSSPMANSYLALTSLYGATHDMRILLLLKMIKEMSKEVTYKEIYFLAVLFEALPVIQSTENTLNDAISKYQRKYPYRAEKITEKKRNVKQAVSQEYVSIFCLDEHGEDIITALEELNIDFKVLKNAVFMNSFYFTGLNHVLESLNNKSKYIA